MYWQTFVLLPALNSANVFLQECSDFFPGIQPLLASSPCLFPTVSHRLIFHW